MEAIRLTEKADSRKKGVANEFQDTKKKNKKNTDNKLREVWVVWVFWRFFLLFLSGPICSWNIKAAQRIGKVQVQKIRYMVRHIKRDVASCLEKYLYTTLHIWQCYVRCKDCSKEKNITLDQARFFKRARQLKDYGIFESLLCNI